MKCKDTTEHGAPRPFMEPLVGWELLVTALLLLPDLALQLEAPPPGL